MYVSGTPEYLVGMEGEDRNLGIRMTAFLKKVLKDPLMKALQNTKQEVEFLFHRKGRKKNLFQDQVRELELTLARAARKKMVQMKPPAGVLVHH